MQQFHESLLDHIREVRFSDGQIQSRAIEMFANAAEQFGDELASSEQLPDMVFALYFAEEISGTNEVLKLLGQNNSLALVKNPNFGHVIKAMALSNQAYEATSLFADIARQHVEELLGNPTINLAIEALQRKDAGNELDAIKSWIDQGHPDDQFPELIRLDTIRQGRIKGKIPESQRQPAMGLGEIMMTRSSFPFER